MGARGGAGGLSTNTLRGLEDLVAEGFVDPAERAALAEVAARYAVALPHAMRALIDPADPRDPIARQIVPDVRELVQTSDERPDPIGDGPHSPCEGLVHRYPDRVLLKLAHVCAVYCRFCFRREMVGPGQGTALSEAALAQALAYIAGHPDIWEVILTGGDPLVVSPRRLASVADRLARIDHVRVLRAHTRLPIAAPEQITPDLVEALKSFGRTVYVAVHVNHPRELSGAARGACARLADAGIVLVSQSVLLRGVNDDVETLSALMRALVEARVKPYYLHHPDLAPGTGHFRLSIEEGQALVRALRGRLSGLCQPTYVLDIPGGHGKAPLGPAAYDGASARVRDFRGRAHAYPPDPSRV